jgi:uncharacterized membrane protein
MIVAPTYLMAVTVAVGAQEILDAGKAVGTANNQIILGILVIALIGVVLYRERQQNKQHAEVRKSHQEATEKAAAAIEEAKRKHDLTIDAFEKERREMNEERRQRWTLIIDVIRDNTGAFRGVRETLDNLQRYLSETRPATK